MIRPALLGLAAGVVSGTFGVGGGVIVVPGLMLLMGLDARVAAATSLATIAASAGAALLLFGQADAVNWSAAVLLFVGSAAGAWVGARVLDRIPAKALTRAFAVVMLLAAYRLAVPA